MSGSWMVALLIAGIFVIGFGVAAFIAWWSMRGETYRRRG